MSKDEAKLDAWLHSLAPSEALRRWYDYDVSRWGVRGRYQSELETNPAVGEVLELVERESVTHMQLRIGTTTTPT
ncbi:MAG: DUF488 family protein [Halodesulfurarchaeum sp.]